MTESKMRKPNRYKGFNYSTKGAYFITICSHNRIPIFSSIEGYYPIGLTEEQMCCLYIEPKITLTKLGECIKETIEIANNNTDVNIPLYVVSG